MQLCELRGLLAGKMHASDVLRLCSMARGRGGDGMKEMLFSLLPDSDRRVASNALWVLTHLKSDDREWLMARQTELVDMAMTVGDTTSRRLILTLLERQDFAPDAIRSDFLDFCLGRMLMDAETVGVRSLCIKLACKMCMHYPELLREFYSNLELVPGGSSAAIRSSRRNAVRRLGLVADGDDRGIF